MDGGNRTRQFFETALSRFLLIILGAVVGFAINIFVYPIWSGEDLHKLLVKKFVGVAKSLEGCVDGYLHCVAYDRIPSKILTYQASDDPLYSGYRSAVESTSQEQTLVLLTGNLTMARTRVEGIFGKTMCNSAVLSDIVLSWSWHFLGILAEIQAPPEKREIFSKEMRGVGTEGAKVLRLLADKLKLMVQLSPGDILYEVHEADAELQQKIDRRSYLLVDAESWEIGNRRAPVESRDDSSDGIESEPYCHWSKFLSETVLDIGAMDFSKNWVTRYNNY